jgi:hypothetical protein
MVGGRTPPKPARVHAPAASSESSVSPWQTPAGNTRQWPVSDVQPCGSSTPATARRGGQRPAELGRSRRGGGDWRLDTLAAAYSQVRKAARSRRLPATRRRVLVSPGTLFIRDWPAANTVRRSVLRRPSDRRRLYPDRAHAQPPSEVINIGRQRLPHSASAPPS